MRAGSPRSAAWRNGRAPRSSSRRARASSGPPNSLLGQLFYLALLAGAVSDWLTDPRLWTLYLGGSLLTVGLGVYLSYALLFVLRVPCPLCFTSHGINAIICGLLLLLRTAG